jgi:hypothetical protein
MPMGRMYITNDCFHMCCGETCSVRCRRSERGMSNILIKMTSQPSRSCAPGKRSCHISSLCNRKVRDHLCFALSTVWAGSRKRKTRCEIAKQRCEVAKVLSEGTILTISHRLFALSCSRPRGR